MASASEKRNRFERLAEKRLTDTIKKLRLVGNLANRHNYSYTDEHVKQILDALDSEMRLLRQRFTGRPKGDDTGFRFKTRRGTPGD